MRIQHIHLDSLEQVGLRAGRHCPGAVVTSQYGFVIRREFHILKIREYLPCANDNVLGYPGQPRYLDGQRRPGTFVPRWNLVVPEFLLQRRWEEMG